MEKYCRLCAELKTNSDELNINISDSTIQIQEKLIACCQWNNYQHDSNLPDAICYSCYEKLEKSWLFSESVAFAQTKLLEIFHEIEIAPVKYESDVDNDGFNVYESESESEKIFVEPIAPSKKTTRKKNEEKQSVKIFVESIKSSNETIHEEKPVVLAPARASVKVVKSLECTTCKRSFRSPYNLEVSTVLLWFYDNRTEFICFSFTPILFQVHSKTHAGEGSHNCLNCGKEFTTASNLRRHLRNVHGQYANPKQNMPEFRYECYQCHRKFRLKWTLQKHLSVHSDDRPYECWLCHKMYVF